MNSMRSAHVTHSDSCSAISREPLCVLGTIAAAPRPAVDQLARQAGRVLKYLYGITGGNPLFVTEALAADADTVPITVRDAVLARAVRLSPAARQIAELVSIVPGKTEAALLKQAGCLDETGIESCLSIGMVRDEDGIVLPSA